MWKNCIRSLILNGVAVVILLADTWNVTEQRLKLKGDLKAGRRRLQHSLWALLSALLWEKNYFFILLWSRTQAPGDQWHGSQSLSAVPSGPFNILPCIISDAMVNINFLLMCISLIITGKRVIKKAVLEGQGSLGVWSSWNRQGLICCVWRQSSSKGPNWNALTHQFHTQLRLNRHLFHCGLRRIVWSTHKANSG